MNSHTPRLESARLILDAFRETDAEALFSYASQPSVARWMAWAPHQSVQESREVLRLLMSPPPGHYEWAIRFRSDGRLIGGFTFAKKKTVGEAEIHFTLAETAWGQGYASEAGRAVLDWAWPMHPEIHYLRTAPAAENIGSRRVLEKLGFVAGTTRHSGFHKFPSGIDVVEYQLARPQTL
jgi:RimJ/RimL family protein N-acetyltransferase